MIAIYNSCTTQSIENFLDGFDFGAQDSDQPKQLEGGDPMSNHYSRESRGFGNEVRGATPAHR